MFDFLFFDDDLSFYDVDSVYNEGYFGPDYMYEIRHESDLIETADNDYFDYEEVIR